MKKFFIICITAVLLGAVLGYIVPIVIPAAYTKLFSVAILAGLESVFSAIKLVIRDRFVGSTFILSFLVNVFIVVMFVFAGDSLGLDLYYVVLLAVGFRLLQNLDVVKVHLFNK